MIISQDLHNEIYTKIDKLSDDDIKLIISLIDKMQPSKKAAIDADSRKKRIREMAGKYDFDEDAINNMRMESMI